MMNMEEVVERLEEAGAAMLAMPSRGYSTGLRMTKLDVVHTALEAYGWEGRKMKPPAPTAEMVTRMDEAFGWLTFIPEKQYVLRRIVGARALVHPLTGRHVYAWRKLAEILGADHKAVMRWHGQAIKLIHDGLAAR
ncbi:MAG: hypothetical protein KGH75_05180 [Rhodospirillales bacterium]|nr:hypothetical protein [Rhodospirillales bacterium]